MRLALKLEMPPKQRFILVGICGLWGLVIATGSFALLRYENSAGVSGLAAVTWPRGSAIPVDAARCTLIMFVHPRCPCSRASLGEFSALLAHCQQRVAAHVLFLRPPGTSEDWTQTDLWRSAQAIPGVQVHFDTDGLEAQRFGAQTSGHTVLYGVDQRLQFHGGITAGRGHAGDNAGSASVLTILLNESQQRATTPVYGCALFNENPPACDAGHPSN